MPEVMSASMDPSAEMIEPRYVNEGTNSTSSPSMFIGVVIEEEEEEYYYTSRTLYQHMKYSYRRKHIAMKSYGANKLQDIQHLPLE